MTRSFPFAFSLFSLLSLSAPGFIGAAAAQPIGVSLPLSGPFAPIALEMKKGILAAIEDRGESGDHPDLRIVDDGCDETAMERIAPELADVSVIIGAPCFKAARALAHTLANFPAGSSQNSEKRKSAPIVMLDTRNGALERERDYNELPLFELSPAPDDEAKALVEYALPQFEGKPFAILDDGSAHGRAFSDSVRLLAQEKGIEPIFVAGFRPLQSTRRALLKRAKDAGAQALVIAAEPEDVFIIARDMKELGIDWPLALNEQSALIAHDPRALELGERVHMVSSRLPETEKRKKLESRFLAQKPGESFLEGYVLAEIALQARARPPQSAFDEPFQTLLGDLRFEHGRADHRPFALLAWNGREFVQARSSPIGQSQ